MFKRYQYRLLNGIGGLGDDTGSGTPDTPPAGGATPPSDDIGGDFNGPEWAKDFAESIGLDVVNDPSLKAIKDIPSLTKSYVHAQKALGKKGLHIPNENSTQEEWDTFHQSLGVPLDEKAYAESLKLPEESIFAETKEDIIKLAHELRIKPDQAAKLLEGVNAKVSERQKALMDSQLEKTQEGLNELMNEMGEDAYKVKLHKTTSFIKEQMPEFLDFLKETGLGNNAQIVKAFMKVTEMVMGEDEIPKGTFGHGMSANEIESQINNIMADFNDAYHKPEHPNHMNRINEVLNMRRKLDKIASQK